mgnify:CR=1 FL=1
MLKPKVVLKTFTLRFKFKEYLPNLQTETIFRNKDMSWKRAQILTEAEEWEKGTQITKKHELVGCLRVIPLRCWILPDCDPL